MNYEGKRVLVLGLGESGLAMSLWLARCGASLRVADTRELPDRLGALREAVPSAEFIGGAFAPALLDGIDFIVASPGLAPERELAGILPAAQESGIPVWGEIELFAQAMQALREERAYVPKIIAITGTNGKTTVTSLTGLLCRRAGLTVQVAGNISPAALDVLRDMLDQDSLPQVWVLELSSFQLHTTFSLQADVATVLNVTQDHLDWHGSLEAYAEAKARIFGTHTVRVLNRDDPTVMKMASPLSPLMTFGAGEPVDADSFGLVSDNGIEWLAAAFAQEEGEAPRRRKKDVVEVPVSVSRLMPSDALRIRGRHNAVNALAALALCRAIGLPLARLLHGLREYHGEPHRVELIATIGGADYYDDSKGTNVGATVAALNGLGVSQGGKLILIAGGLGKDQDFGPLVEPVAKYARLVLLIGKDAPALRTALEPSGVEMKDCATLEDAVQQAAAIAAAGDAVLLSPACASMDMFRNYEHRADAFKAAVHEIAMARGEVIA